jgi:hypothetical protein
MNLGPNGKKPILRPGRMPNGEKQEMVFPPNYHDKELRGKPKGIQVVLEERGLWKDGMRLECAKKGCANKAKVDCCARKLLSEQPDFKEQKGWIQETVEKMGHKVLFYPRFHCELNYIEYFWAAVKEYAREHCDYSFKGLKEVVPRALESVEVLTIRKFARRAQRYMDAYRKGLTQAQAEFAVKTYRSHRRIPDVVSKDADPMHISS